MENPTLPTNWLAALSNANHVRKQKIGQNSLTSLRPAPPTTAFRSCRGLFRGTFFNFAKRIKKIIVSDVTFCSSELLYIYMNRFKKTEV